MSLHLTKEAMLICLQLGNAYQELAKELSSEKLKTIGGYTLGRVIGEGKSDVEMGYSI